MDDLDKPAPPVHRRHPMPFGAELTAAGTVSFRLWAPAARRVQLALYEADARQLIDMEAQPGGWYQLECAAARAGSRYRFRIDGELEVPDPASRFNPQGVHGPSAVIDPRKRYEPFPRTKST